MRPDDLRGIYPPLPTPFDADGELDLDALAALVAALAPRVDGVLILGSNGEAAFLTPEERGAALRAARTALPPGATMLAGTGAETTRATMANTEAAAAAGADAALILPPHYYRGQMSDPALATHYLRVADASPIPVVLYNIPAVTGLRLAPQLVAELAQHGNIIGIKDSSGDLGGMTEIVRIAPADFAVLTGNAPTVLPALALGARGGILAVANVAPEAYRELVAAFQAGDLARARALQTRFNPLALAVTARWGVPGLKATLRLQGLPAGLPRAPLMDVSAAVEAELRELLATLGLQGVPAPSTTPS